MSLFGSVGIGPVRVGASTRGRRSSNAGGFAGPGGFFICLIVVFAFHYWYVTLPIVGFGLLLWGIGYLIKVDGDAKSAEAAYQDALARQAAEQHAALMNGDEQLGTYGNYPPADLEPKPVPKKAVRSTPKKRRTTQNESVNVTVNVRIT